MQGSPKLVGLGADSKLRKSLEDLISLLWLLSLRPTHVQELVPPMPHFAGYHDAAAEGAGGVWFLLCNNTPPMIWREEFPTDIAADVVSEDTPHGRLTKSDLELTAEVLAVGVELDRINNRKHTPLGTLYDNTLTVSWIDKMASKATSPTTGRLLRGLAIMLYHAHAGRLTTVHVPGIENVMADIASHPSKAQKLFHSTHALTDLDFCSSFDAMFLLPGNHLWTLAAVPQWLKFNVCKTLHGKQLDLQQWMGPRENATGGHGKHTAASIKTTRAPFSHHTSSPTGSSPLLLPCGKASTVRDIKYRRKSPPACLPKACSGWTSQPSTCLARPTHP
jgi:hypothetical protein